MNIDYSDRYSGIQEDYDAMFGAGPGTELVKQIPIEMLKDFPNQPFKPYSEAKLQELAADIAANGILSPLRVRTHEGKYQILAGHNRRSAAVMAGLITVPCIIKDVDDDTAAIIVTTTNLNQREELLPSEKAFAYKMQLNALNHQGKSTSSQVETKLRSDEQIAASSNESRAQIQRYIRLTYLVPELLQMVDDKSISFMAGVNLSYHHETLQRELFGFMQTNNIAAVSLKQSEAIKKLSDLTEDRLQEVFGLAPQKSKITRPTGKKTKKAIDSYFAGREMTDAEIAELIVRALESYENQ